MGRNPKGKCRKPKRRISWGERVFELENVLQDLDLAEKQALINFGWTLDEYESADYYRLNEVLAAKEAKDRVVDPMAFIK